MMLVSIVGQAIFHTTDDSHLLAPWTGFAFFCLYTALALTIASLAIRQTDA